MIIIDIINPDVEPEENIEKKETKKVEISQEDLKKLPQTSLQIISIDGTIILQ